MRRVHAIIAGRDRLHGHPVAELVFPLTMLGFAIYMVWISQGRPAWILIAAVLTWIAAKATRGIIRSWRSGEYRHRGIE